MNFKTGGMNFHVEQGSTGVASPAPPNSSATLRPAETTAEILPHPSPSMSKTVRAPGVNPAGVTRPKSRTRSHLNIPGYEEVDPRVATNNITTRWPGKRLTSPLFPTANAPKSETHRVHGNARFWKCPPPRGHRFPVPRLSVTITETVIVTGTAGKYIYS